ncbi:SH3 and multiple ankyrin repeat domains protein 2b isoform X2 [Salvelinus fontinalis]|uniref:SH3 and multiple ankyrin repeat domains protein 2b isoform X2 n=1 Tax=Salvelinus fontinalis TaxID=8038 RepID=UPI00248628CF|nr:SH3 and multiple ankyrin repeat domains protein 2b isoform X2 [Salvelinus fontinalis]
MPRSPTSSEEEMAQSVSDGSGGFETDSSKEEAGHGGLGGERASRRTDRRAEKDKAARRESLVFCVVIPDLQQSTCMRFKPEATVWVAKQQILCTLTQTLRDVLNYGLFQPAVEGRMSGFLDEERPLKDYPTPTSIKGVPTLEFRYKSRVYQQPNVNEKQIAKIHTQANYRKFMDHIQHHQLDKVAKMLEKGLDPNYHDPDTGETPLTFAAHLYDVEQVIVVLKQGGAHLDFRSQDGMTALHHAVRAKNQAALKALLDLGASPDYKDSQSLTPLYHTVLVEGDPSCCELLLRAHATISCHDENGWHEIHQACRYGHVQHLEHLLFYRADIGVQNASGNTALHICALYKQEHCARVLLVRGANKEVKNYRSQTSFQVAIIAGNFELAELIKNHKETDIVPFREAPAQPSRRKQAPRSTLAAPRPTLLRSNSDNNLNVNNRSPLPSPSHSPLRSLSPRRPQQQQMPSPNGTVRTMGKGAPRPPRSPSLGRLGEEARRQTPQRQPSPHRGREAFSDAIDSQGPKRKLYSAVPGKHYVVTQSYQPQAEGEIPLYKNDKVKVLSIGESGFWEGSARGNLGWFPAECVEENIPNQVQEEKPYARADRAERRKLFRHYTVGSYDSFDASSDCVIDEKTVVLQKKDNEGFGFVLRGAKADTPIEEFTPTPAFPALQYLESVDEGGVAWRSGLRNGDFLIEVNQENVVKVGHKQVVNTIRHGGNRLIIKVVTVSRNLDPDDTARKKVPTPPRRAPSTALSMAMRSKSMTSELEELATLRKKVTGDKVDENMPPQKPMWENSNADVRVANTVKSRPNSRCFAMSPEMNSMCESQDMPMQTQTQPQPREPGSPRGRGPYLGVPNRQGTMRRQKSIGTSGITEEETPQFLTPPMLKFTRSLSMPDTSEDIPPPPAISPPSPPYNNVPNPQGRGYGTIRHSAPKGTAPERGDLTAGGSDGWREQGGMYYREPQSEQYQSEDHHHQQGSHSPGQGLTAQQSFLNRRAQIPENPYSDLGKMGNLGLFAPNKPQRRKGMLVKQDKIEDSPEKTCTIKIPTIIIKEPSTSSSGKSSQGSSMEIETGAHDHPGQLRPDDGHNPSSPFATAMAGAVRERERRMVESHQNSPSYRFTDQGDEDSPPAPTPRLRHSKSIDEGMFSSDERLRRIMAPPASLLNIHRGGGNVTNFNTSESNMVREPLHTRTGHHSPVSLPNKTYTSSSGHYVHPVTGKPLDPNSPLALALAARDRAMREQSQPLPLKTELPKPDLNKPLFIDTKLRTGMDGSFSATATMGRPGRAGLRRQMTEAKYETESKYDHPLAKDQDKSLSRPEREEEKKNMLIDIVDTSQQKSAGLLMVHTTDGARSEENSLSEGDRDGAVSSDSTPSELRDPNQPNTSKMSSPNPHNSHSMGPGPRGSKTMITVTSVDEPVKLPFGIPPPPCVPSVDIDDDFFADPLPPPLEFANSFDIPEDQKGAIAELLKQHRNAGRAPSSLAPFYPHHGNTPSHPDQTMIKRPAVLTNCMPPSFPPNALESYEPISDSGIDVEPDSRSSGDPQMETTSTVSTVSSISTLSSDGGEALDNTCTVYADGQAFLVDRTSKPKNRQPAANKSNALYKDPALMDKEENLRTFGTPSSVPPPPPGASVLSEPPRTPTQRTSKLWGDPPGSNPYDMQNKDKTPKPGDGIDSSSSGCRTVFGSRAPDGGSLASGTQRNTTVTFAAQLGPSVPAPSPKRETESLPHHRAPSPILSPPDSGLGCASSLPATSPTLSDVFGLPTPPLSLGTGSSRSPSPLTLMQAASNKPFATKPVLMWSKHDVADWLESLNLAEHRDTFMDNDIEGSHLPSLQKDDLIDLGVTRVGHRMNIERALKLLMDR